MRNIRLKSFFFIKGWDIKNLSTVGFGAFQVPVALKLEVLVRYSNVSPVDYYIVMRVLQKSL